MNYKLIDVIFWLCVLLAIWWHELFVGLLISFLVVIKIIETLRVEMNEVDEE